MIHAVSQSVGGGVDLRQTGIPESYKPKNHNGGGKHPKL